MADQKISQLPSQTTASNDDVLPIVDDPGGSAATKKITFANLVASISAFASITAVAIGLSGALTLSQQPAGRVLYTESGGVVTSTPDLTYATPTKMFGAPNATIPGLNFTNATGTNATTTSLAATVICLTGDSCRTTWPTSGGGGSGVGWADNGSILYNSTPTTPVVVWSSLRSPYFMATTTGVGFSASGTIDIAGTGTSTFAGSVNMSGNVSSTAMMSRRYFVTSDGSQSAPAISRAGSQTGIWFNGAGQIDFTLNGNSGGLIDSSNGWQPNLGIQPLSANTGFVGTASAPFLNVFSQNVSSTVATTTNLIAANGAFSSTLTLGGQSVCLANGTNCPSSYASLTVTTLSSTNINVRNIREANGSTASSTITLSARSGEIDTTTNPRPTSTLLTLSGFPRTLPAMNASTTNCIYWGPEFIRDAWDGALLKPTISWTNATGSGAVVWRLRAQSIADNAYIGAGFTGTASYATGTAGTGYFNQNDAMDSLTVGGAATGTPMEFELCRIGAQAGDTFGTDAYPNSIKIEYGLGQYSD